MARPSHFPSQSKPVFQLIQGGLVAESVPACISPRPAWYIRRFNTVQDALRAVLKARLTPTKTVEDACHLDFQELEAHELTQGDEAIADFRMLRKVGLQPILSEPSRIVLRNADRFAAAFPDLVNAIPVLLAHDGVQPYTEGLPASFTPITVHSVDEKQKLRKLPYDWKPSNFNERQLLGKFTSVEDALSKVLKAKLTHTLTVEKACGLPPISQRKMTIAPETQQSRLNLIRSVGLKIVKEGKLPPGIMIENPTAFAGNFPELEGVIRVMYAYEGVQPYTNGVPRRMTPKGLQRKKRTAI